MRGREVVTHAQNYRGIMQRHRDRHEFTALKRQLRDGFKERRRKSGAANQKPVWPREGEGNGG